MLIDWLNPRSGDLAALEFSPNGAMEGVRA
jgi:hypothetical protein